MANGGRLLFMTYNGWVMIAVTVGAFVGYLAFGNSTSATKDGACH
jgi:copper transporter 1